MYDGATTTVRSTAGLTEEFKVGVGLHQGSALSPFLFAIILDKLTEDIRKDAPWHMLFVDGKYFETKSIGSNGKYFRAVATPNREKPKEEEDTDSTQEH